MYIYGTPLEPTFYKDLLIKSFEGFPVRMNFSRFHSVSFGQDPRSKIAEMSFAAILDPGRARMKPNETE